MTVRAIVGGAVLVGAALVVHVTTPTDEERVEPFVEAVEVGDWGEGRTVAARVEDVAVAGQVTDGDWTGSTDGLWVVVTLAAEVSLQPGLVYGSLVLGDLQFDMSARAGSSALNGVSFSPGFPQRGDLLFEVTAAALGADGADARLRIATTPSPRLDSVVEVPLDLAEPEPEELHELAPVERASR